MAFCEMCGRESVLMRAKVEGVELSVCQGCGKHGKVLQNHPSSPYSSANGNAAFRKVRVEKEWKVVADFSQLLRSAREKRNLSQQDFAVFLQEKESVVKKWEAGSVKPSLESAQKLERVLGTSLVIEDDSLVSSSLPSRKSDELTLGDVMNVKK